MVVAEPRSAARDRRMLFVDAGVGPSSRNETNFAEVSSADALQRDPEANEQSECNLVKSHAPIRHYSQRIDP